MGFLKTLSNSTGNTNLPTLQVPTPSDILGSALKAWYSADKLVTFDGSNRISSWGDRSATAAALTVSTASNQPLYVASAKNSRPGAKNDSFGTTLRNIMTSAVVPSSQFEYTAPFSIGVSFVAGTLTGLQVIFGNYGNDGGYIGYWLASSGGKVQLNVTANISSKTFSITDSTSLVTGTAYSFIITYDGSGTNAGLKIYKNGALILSPTRANTGTISGADTIISAAQRIISFGAEGGTQSSNTFLEGFICSGALTAAQVASLDYYLNAKYAIH